MAWRALFGQRFTYQNSLAWRNFKLIRFVRVLRGKIITWRILVHVSELLTKNWITIRFIFSSSDVDWHLDQPIKRKKTVAHKIRENPIVASFYHFLTELHEQRRNRTTWRSSGVLVSGGGRAKVMIDMKIEEDEDKRMRSWKTKRRSRRSTRTLSRRFSMAILYKQPRKRR